MTIEKFIGEEVFIVAPDETCMDDDQSSEMHVTGNFMELVEDLQGKGETDLPLRVVNGILTTARNIPNDLFGKNPWLVVVNPLDPDIGYLIELYVDNSDDVAEAIERIIDEGRGLMDIDDIFILYGYELNICLAVNEDELDEDSIETCKKIATKAEMMS
jgi:hypothetical protein